MRTVEMDVLGNNEMRTDKMDVSKIDSEPIVTESIHNRLILWKSDIIRVFRLPFWQIRLWKISAQECRAKQAIERNRKKKWKYLQTINTYTLCFMETVSSKHLQVQCQGSLKIELTHAQRSRAPLTHSLRFPTHMDDLCRASEHSWRRSRTFQLFYRINQSAVASCKRQEKRTPSN